MGEAFKDIYTEQFLRDFSHKVSSVYGNFQEEEFTAAVLAASWENLALRGRMLRIVEVLGRLLPSDYEEALEILYRLVDDCEGFPYLFFPDFVAAFGLKEEYWDTSMKALECFTKHSSSEFAIRPFILKDTERTMKCMLKWSSSSNEHVRRLSSEGCRPRLPWSMDLPVFKRDPVPVLQILENLKADSSLYVRKSVANNLNDIAKDHPDLVLSVTRKWIGKTPETDWILRHGCRTLIRKALPEALALFGYADTNEAEPLVLNANCKVSQEQLSVGDTCLFQYSLDVNRKNPVHIRLEYGIDFVKSKGKTSRKLFLLSDRTVPGNFHLEGSHNHSFADLTTRKHYPGLHNIVLLINGMEVATTTLLLQ
ncbi:DNA alkylation repair protein [Anaerocolumna sp. AGMB13020]|uniref:DNA alkylation repair protein n=1 Tax=Anaerocolumna sp. AGMB13020 TaxID=3081750 RepID=UPI002955DE50|nr:DNA alkylation repair protein [Anaerocolumna sp. AGMB13020]WOO35942.1 DNA alkylation repair protein [Anaerocolumna sp. AGMB13020]